MSVKFNYNGNIFTILKNIEMKTDNIKFIPLMLMCGLLLAETSCSTINSNGAISEAAANDNGDNTRIYEGKKSIGLTATITFPPNLSTAEQNARRHAMANSTEMDMMRAFAEEVATTTSWKDAHLIAQAYLQKNRWYAICL